MLINDDVHPKHARLKRPKDRSCHAAIAETDPAKAS